MSSFKIRIYLYVSPVREAHSWNIVSKLVDKKLYPWAAM